MYNAARPLHVLGGVSDSKVAQLRRARGSHAKAELALSWLREFVIREGLSGSLGDVHASIVSRVVQIFSAATEGYYQARKVASNIADGKDSILRWFEEYTHRLHQHFYAVGILDPHDDDDGDDNSVMFSLLRYPTVNDTASCSRAVTRGVEVVSSATFVEEMGMFVYSIRMRLLTPDDGDDYMSPEQRGFDTCQLVSRHWKISKFPANGPPVIDEVRGEGVIGYFPILCEAGPQAADRCVGVTVSRRGLPVLGGFRG